MATRRERVIIEAVDDFSTPVARMAAATALLDKNLKSLDGSTTKTNRTISQSNTQYTQASKELDRFSGRARLATDAVLTLGPALVPIAAVGIPALAGLASSFGAAALAGGVAIAAFQSVGDALKAVNTAALEPTTANLEAARIAMQALSPEARSFVTELQAMRPQLLALRDAAAGGLFPGLEDGLESLVTVLPRVATVMAVIADAAGDLGREFGESLSGPRAQEFLTFLGAEMPGVLTDLGHTVGNLAAGLGELWMAFTPLNRDASSWLLDISQSFDGWASGLAETDGFRDFVAYIRDTGPQVSKTLVDLGNALLQIAEAAAPLGGPTLQALSAFANLVSAIAGSRFGPALLTAASALVIISRALKVVAAVKASTLFTSLTASADGAAGSMTKMAKAAQIAGGALAGLAIVDAVQGGLKDYSVGVEQMTQSLLGLQAASSAGLPDDLEGIAHSIERLADPNAAQNLQDNISDALGGIGGGSELKEARAQIEALDTALTNLVAQGQPDLAQGALDNLGLSKGQMDDLLGLLPQYKDALAGVANEAALAGAAAAAGGREAAAGWDQARFAAQRFATEMERVDALLSKRATMRDFEASLDDFRKMVKGIKDTERLLNKDGSINIDLAKGREVQEQLDHIADSAKEVAKTLTGTKKIEFLAQARRDFVTAARDLGLTRDQARALADQFKLLDRTHANPKATLQDQATAQIAALKARLAALDGDSATVTTYVRTVHTGGRAPGPQEFNGASGGYTGRGGKYEYAGIVHKGELVLPQEVVNRDWSMLKSRYSGLPGFADGGLVGGTHTRGADVGGVGELGRAAHHAANELDKERDGRRKNGEQQEKLVERLKSKIDEIRSAVSGAYQQDIFSSGSELTGLGFSSGQLMAQQQAVRDQALTANIREQREAIRLLKELRKRGLDGPAFVQLAATGDVDALRSYASLSKRDLRTFEKRFELSQSLDNRLQNVAAGPERRRLAAEAKQLHGIQRTLDQIKKQGENGPERTGKAAGDAVNRAVVAGHKGRAR